MFGQLLEKKKIFCIPIPYRDHNFSYYLHTNIFLSAALFQLILLIYRLEIVLLKMFDILINLRQY